MNTFRVFGIAKKNFHEKKKKTNVTFLRKLFEFSVLLLKNYKILLMSVFGHVSCPNILHNLNYCNHVYIEN